MQSLRASTVWFLNLVDAWACGQGHWQRPPREGLGVRAACYRLCCCIWIRVGEDVMSIALCIKQSLELPEFVVRCYLEGLTDADLLVRPLEGMNHIAWQLGHLIGSEHGHIETLFPGTMPALPDGFCDRHTRATSGSDAPSDFLAKSDYLKLMASQREGTLHVLLSLSDQQLQEEAPESIRYLGPTVGCVFTGEASHWMMHAGQWAVIRRKLGHSPLF